MATTPRRRSTYQPAEHLKEYDRTHPKPARTGKGTDRVDGRVDAAQKDNLETQDHILKLLGDTVDELKSLQVRTDYNLSQLRKQKGMSEQINILHAMQRRTDAKLASAERDKARITEDATSGNPLREAKAARQSEELNSATDTYVRDAIEAQDREIEGLRSEVREIKEEDLPKVYDKIDSNRTEQQAFNEGFKSDIAEHETRISEQAAVTTAFPAEGLIVALVVGIAVGVLVFLIRFLSGSGFTANVTAPDGTVFTTMIEEPFINRFWNSVILGLAFGSLAAFIAWVIVTLRYINSVREERTARTETIETEETYVEEQPRHGKVYYWLHPNERPRPAIRTSDPYPARREEPVETREETRTKEHIHS